MKSNTPYPKSEKRKAGPPEKSEANGPATRLFPA